MVLPLIGYDRYKLKGQKGYSLAIKESEANVIRLIFKLYAEGNGLQSICNILNNKNIPSPSNSTWVKSSISAILRKQAYIGKIKYIDKKRIKKVVDGKVIRVVNPNPDIIISEGLHEPIIDIDTWNKVQSINKSHLKVPTIKIDKSLKNPFSSILICKKCGRPLRRVTDTRRNNENRKNERLDCKFCDNIGSSLNIVEERILQSLSDLLNLYKLQLVDNVENDIDANISVTENAISETQKELELSEKQKLKIYDLLEQGIYDNDTFLDRSKKNASKILDLKNHIQKLKEDKIRLEELNNNKKNIIPRVENVIQTYYSIDSAKEKNKLLKTAISKIEYLKENPKAPDDFELTIYPFF